MVLVFRDKTSFDRIRADIVCTPDIEGGIGPVMIGTPAMGADGRCLVAHNWAEVDGDWLAAYTGGENPPMQILAAAPPDWKPAEAKL